MAFAVDYSGQNSKARRCSYTFATASTHSFRKKTLQIFACDSPLLRALLCMVVRENGQILGLFLKRRTLNNTYMIVRLGTVMQFICTFFVHKVFVSLSPAKLIPQ